MNYRRRPQIDDPYFRSARSVITSECFALMEQFLREGKITWPKNPGSFRKTSTIWPTNPTESKKVIQLNEQKAA